jgi:hypothetical protein
MLLEVPDAGLGSKPAPVGDALCRPPLSALLAAVEPAPGCTPRQRDDWLEVAVSGLHALRALTIASQLIMEGRCTAFRSAVLGTRGVASCLEREAT